MKDFINSYTYSRQLVKQRISELSALRSSLVKRGESARAKALDLDRRISLLYEEHGELQAVIAYLSSYRRGEGIGKT